MMLVLPLAFAISACGGPNEEGNELEENPVEGSAAPDVTSETTPPPVPPEVGDTTGVIEATPETP